MQVWLDSCTKWGFSGWANLNVWAIFYLHILNFVGHDTPDKGLARFALSLEKKDLRILVGLLTGHVDLNRHLKIMGLRNEAVCPLCQDEEETSIHFVAQCSATMLLRKSILGDYTLSLDTLNGIHWMVLLRFAKASKRFLRP